MLNEQFGIATIASAVVVLAIAGGAVGIPVAVDSAVDQKPGDPLYGLEKAGESIKGVFVREDQDWHLERAEERVQEFRSVAGNGNSEKYRGVLDEAGERASEAMKKSGDVEGLERAAQTIRRNIQVLENVKNQVPENAKPAIDRAITRSRMQVKALTQTSEEVEDGKIPPGRLKEELENNVESIENLIDALDNKELPPGILKEVLENREITLDNLENIIDGRDLPPGILKEILSGMDVPKEELEEFLKDKDLPPGIEKEILEGDDSEDDEESEEDREEEDEPEEDDEEEETEEEPERFVHEEGELPEWAPGKPPWAGEDDEEEMEEDEGFELLEDGVKITNPPANYKVNPAAYEDLSTENVVREIKEAFETWDSHTSTELFDNNVDVTDKSGFERDGENVISFAPMEDSEEVAITEVWYENGEVLEFDIVLNSNVDWGIDPDGEGPATINAYDIQNIATHEAGHTLALQDIYDDDYANLTMFYRSEIGSTNKISLENGDINGLQTLYGE
ncbi:hypothetical protein AKJ37_07220 [candidate division MSBL1 archaeon SCGC-AAA259I09]|uniref:Peptidase metallopeptidase domain-containing protein n=5 Tax=candidate division MSBL1 TaxID=215777 RepID=A0A133UQZ0_9EURY|nr:hypothetical protein AKJ62_00995 [candidate division MSBL1 archaeon SCGC-AAA259D14]KXA92291.1 hypothetical protein AKJ66_04395 [candidate division MSBL1 archaeon SCGC-AAA259E22]KXA94885.1 hypothetical protein AKJ37_07220 [candidate division MSBL1 archaeon SCGC-AAA259I09]KXA96603.1 hypothetical protein AKJ38_02995 [candidate division MSBL1 archaeon SCGC-AAA259I14]KXA99780.1 hypothetical protein AKJ40_02435 [candidate division MSBL1 archaeon SCGC-AAA259M10]